MGGVVLAVALGLGVVTALEYLTRGRGGLAPLEPSGAAEVPEGARG